MKNRKRSHPVEGPRLSRSTKRLFALMTLLGPFLLLALVEGVLRIIEYGPDLSLFRTEVIGDRVFRIMNPEVKHRYFSTVQFSPNTSLDSFQEPKPATTYRIFCLGGSTTAGFPYGYAGSFAAYLRDRLRRTFPDRAIEVINLGMTATNSYTVNDIARELFSHQPDLIIVNDGHNEFYGALGSASREAHGSARWMTLLYLKLIHFRTFMMLKDAYAEILGLFSRAGTEDAGGTMMERLARGKEVPLGSDMYLLCLENFRANLLDLVATCSEQRVPLFLTSQVSNLRDMAPFAPQTQGPLPGEAQLEFDLNFNSGLQLILEGRPDAALAAFRKASLIDSVRAGVQYQIGKSLDRLGLHGPAEHRYVRARDFDMLRFRASSEFNEAIREAGEKPGAYFVDMESAFRAAAPDSLIGFSLILEHLHPNQKGYFLMAREYARAMRAQRMIADDAGWAHADLISEDSLWNDRGLTEIDERAAARRIEILTSGWPFQPTDIALRSLNPDDPLMRIVDRMVGGEMNWEQAHVAAGEYYETLGHFEKARTEYHALIRMIPMNVSAYHLLARTYFPTGQQDRAAEILRESISVEPTSYAYRMLGSIAIDQGRPDAAVPDLMKALQYSPGQGERAHITLLLGLAHLRMGERQEAIVHLREVLRISPGNQRAQELLRQAGGE